MKIDKKILKRLIYATLLFVVSVLVFSDTPKAPNELIVENPYKEVKTVDANKNREHAKMEIGVTKINLVELEGKILENGKVMYILPVSNTKAIDNSEIVVVKEIEQLTKDVAVKKYATVLSEIVDENKVLVEQTE
ncbi:MAG: hypothetical protein ACRC51_08820, partial [Cetobacterium sp.]